MRLARRLAAAGAVLALAGAAGAADLAAGRAKALAACAACHGPLGVSVLPDAPHLAGQPAIYLVAQLKAYRGGRRAHEVMGLVAKPLTDAEIEDVAAWYSSLKFEVKPP